MITQEELDFLEEEVKVAQKKLKKAENAYDKFADKIAKRNEPDPYPPALERVQQASREFEAFISENAENGVHVSEEDLILLARTLYDAEFQLARVNDAMFEEEQKIDELRSQIEYAREEIAYKAELVLNAERVNEALAKFKPKCADVLL